MDAEAAGLEFLKRTYLDQGKTPDIPDISPKICGICRPDQKIIHLPPPGDIIMDPALLRDSLDDRRTIREYSDEPISRWELSLLLHYTQGVRIDAPESYYRTVPSAGGIHPFETYLVVNRIDQFESGIYRYLPIDHALVRETCLDDDIGKIADTCRNPKLIRGSAVTFIWTAIPDRMFWKFGSRGWRYLFIEAGHICQNLYLIAGAIGCGICPVGSFHDEQMNCVLGIDGRSEFCIYLATVGKKQN